MKSIILYTILAAIEVLGQSNSTDLCPDLECPSEYQLKAKDDVCMGCKGPNCGGFAGKQCENGLECQYVMDTDYGYCIKQAVVDQVAGNKAKEPIE